MNAARFAEITARYSALRIAIVGDFCLDRYFDIDPTREEISIETGLPVHNIVRVRCQPGAAGTILNNLVALGIGRIFPIGICGDDGEGFELRRSLQARAGTDISYFVASPQRHTFTYTKPLVCEAGKAPLEQNRLDIKNWTPTPENLQEEVCARLRKIAGEVDAIILLDQVDIAETGVITKKVLDAVRAITKEWPELLVIADSRRGLSGYPKISFKMNRREFSAMTSVDPKTPAEMKSAAKTLAAAHGKPVFVTMAEQGIVGANPSGETSWRAAFPLRGEIDIVGAGDSVTANLISAVAAGGNLDEALEFAMTAASVVIHQLGTTGTATPAQIEELMRSVKMLM